METIRKDIQEWMDNGLANKKKNVKICRLFCRGATDYNVTHAKSEVMIRFRSLNLIIDFITSLNS